MLLVNSLPLFRCRRSDGTSGYVLFRSFMRGSNGSNVIQKLADLRDRGKTMRAIHLALDLVEAGWAAAAAGRWR